MRMKDEVAVVTGVGPGLGKAIAVTLAREGADVVICDVNDESLAEASREVKEAGGACLAVRCDVSSSTEVSDMFAAAVERFGTVHTLVNNAALTPNRPVDTERRNKPRDTPTYVSPPRNGRIG